MQINEDKVKERKSFCVPKGGTSQKLAWESHQCKDKKNERED